MVDKKVVIDALCVVFERKLEALRASLESTRERARDAPGSNVSHSDTSKFQLSNEALGLDGQIQEVSQIIASIRQASTALSGRVRMGALVTLYDFGNESSREYFFVARGGGEKVVCDGEEISSIAVAAPLARACMGKEEGDEVVFNGKTYEIQSLR